MANKFFGIDPNQRTTVPDGIRKTGAVADSSGSKSIYDKYFNQLLFELKVDHLWGTEDQVKATEPEATFYTDATGAILDKNDNSVTLKNDDRIFIVYNEALTANLAIDCQDKRIYLRTEPELELDLGSYVIEFSNATYSDVSIRTNNDSDSFDKINSTTLKGRLEVNSKVNFTTSTNVGDSSNTNSTLTIESSEESSVSFKDSGSSAKEYKIGTNISASTDNLEIYDVTDSRAIATFDSSGNVGIGTSTPSTELDVDGGINAASVADSFLDLILPIGAILPYPCTKARDATGTLIDLSTTTDDLLEGRFLLCNGESLETGDYPELFNRIGYTYGGSGVNFELPDFAGKFLRGVGGRASGIGVEQDDALFEHTHYLFANTIYGDSSNSNSPTTFSDPSEKARYRISNGSFYPDYWIWPTTVDATIGRSSLPEDGGTYGDPNVAEETRPTNFSTYYLIRAL